MLNRFALDRLDAPACLDDPTKQKSLLDFHCALYPGDIFYRLDHFNSQKPLQASFFAPGFLVYRTKKTPSAAQNLVVLMSLIENYFSFEPDELIQGLAITRYQLTFKDNGLFIPEVRGRHKGKECRFGSFQARRLRKETVLSNPVIIQCL